MAGRKRLAPSHPGGFLRNELGTSPQYWLNLQNAYDLEVADREIRPQVEREVLPRSAA